MPRHLGLIDAVAIFCGIILGSGIFVAPSAVSNAAPNVLGGIAIWIFGGLICLCGALCYAECGARLPHVGGFFVFYREAYGEPLAFVAGWMALLVTYSSSLAAIAHVHARYLSDLFPALSEHVPLVAAAALVVAGLLNVLGLQTGPRALRVLTGTKLVALVVLCLAALFGSSSATSAPRLDGTEAATFGFAVLLPALVVVFWTYDGWSDVTIVAGELRDPARNLGRTALIGIATMATCYALVQLSVDSLLPAAQAASSDRVVADAVESGLGDRAGRLVAALVVLSTFGSLNAITLTGSRIAFAMARGGVFFRSFGHLHPRWQTPARGLVVLVVASLVYALAGGGFWKLVELFTFAIWLFYGLTAIALLRLRHRGVGEPLEWRAPGGPLAPIVILLMAAGMGTSLIIESPFRSAFGLALMAAGFVAHWAWRRFVGPAST